jgi:hypothetical protein
LPQDRQTPPLRERLRSGKWRSPTPGPSHHPDDDGQSTSQSGVVKIPRLDQAVRAAGLASTKSWAGKDSPPESVASNQSGGSRRSRARQGGGWRRLDTPPRFWVSCSILCTQHPWKPSPRLKSVELHHALSRGQATALARLPSRELREAITIKLLRNTAELRGNELCGNSAECHNLTPTVCSLLLCPWKAKLPRNSAGFRDLSALQYSTEMPQNSAAIYLDLLPKARLALKHEPPRLRRKTLKC